MNETSDPRQKEMMAFQQLIGKKDKAYQKEIAKIQKEHAKEVHQLQKQLASVTKKLLQYQELERTVGFRGRKRPVPTPGPAGGTELALTMIAASAAGPPQPE